MPQPALKQTTAPASEISAVNGRAASSRPVVLSLQLRIPDSSGNANRVSFPPDFTTPASPAAALAVDVITASGGATESAKGAFLFAKFPSLASALLAARRLHWALQGLAEGGLAATAAIAIQTAEEDLPAAAALENAMHGRLLLTSAVADALQNLPGLTLLPADEGPWRQLEWQSGHPRDLATDEQAVLGLIRTLGREDPLAAAAAAPPPPSVSVGTGNYQAPAALGRSVLDEPESTPVPLWKKPWAVVGAAAAVLVLVALLIIRGMTPSSSPQATTPPSAPPAAAPAPSSPVSSPATVQEKPPAAKPSAKTAKQTKSPPAKAPVTEAKTEPKTETPAPPPPPTGSCDLNPPEIPLSLQRAARLMSAGKLADAQAAYQRLVGCPSARDQALEGLRTVKQRMEFQGSPR